MCLDGNVDMMIEGIVFGIGKVFDTKELFCLLNTMTGKNGGSRLLVNNVILVLGVKILLCVHLFNNVFCKGTDECISSVIELGGF